MKTNFWNKIYPNFSDYLLITVSLLSFFGALVYYIYALNWLGVIISLILTLVTLILIDKSHFLKPVDDKNYPSKIKNFFPYASEVIKKNYLYLSGYTLSVIILVSDLIINRSGRALISPWQVVDTGWFWIYTLASLTLILILIKNDIPTGLKIALISTHYLISFSVALVIYKIGFGFDPFIHQATMQLIDNKGLVLPKPPYYIGEYSLVIIIHKIFGLSINFLNKFLVPGLAALFLPLAYYRFLLKDQDSSDGQETEWSASIFLTSLFLLVLTYSPFTLTTPQNLSYIFLILTVLAGFGRFNIYILSLLALTTTAIHPLTGLPALCWVLWLALKEYGNKISPCLQRILNWLIWLFAAIDIPVALFLTGGSKLNTLKINWLFFWEPLKNILNDPGTAGREDWLLNLVYFLNNNLNLILISVIAISIWYFYHKNKTAKQPVSSLQNGLLYMAGALLIAYCLSSLLKFDDLINYEQAGYASRIPIIIFIFLLPFIIVFIQQLIFKIRQEEKMIRFIWLMFGLAILTASLYISYPRFDKYWNSRGYSTSANDLTAVKLIEKQATRPYVALANQQVSAAALKELGFDHYYNTDSGLLYFYPIPTGGPLYQYYLEMVYKNPDKASMMNALDLVGVDEGYLIVDKYWYQSGNIINQAKLAADKWWSINDDVFIFKYNR